MGVQHAKQRKFGDGGPGHPVTITKPFYLGVVPVTVSQYLEFVRESGYDGRPDANEDYLAGATSWAQACPEVPITSVSWYNADAYCRYLTEKHGMTFRLPTEAEWEYACRAGTRTRYFFGKSKKQADEFVWHGGNSGGRPHAVGQKKANPWGLFDMLGNVCEWCHDWFDGYSGEPQIDPSGPSMPERVPAGQLEEQKVVRGGSWWGNVASCAFRLDLLASSTATNLGFRLALTNE